MDGYLIIQMALLTNHSRVYREAPIDLKRESITTNE